MTLCDHYQRIVFLLLKQKVSGGQEQEQVFVAMEFTKYFYSTEVAMESVGRK